MTASLDPKDMLPGVHRVKKRGNGKVTEHWYAWRGGPSILKVSARGDDELARLVATAAPAAIVAFQDLGKPKGDSVTLHGLITRYLLALEAMPGAPRTKRDLRKHLDKVRDQLGKLEIRALESKRARLVLTTWRDKFKETPKTADELFGALSKVISWAVDRGEVALNPIKDVEGLYHAPDRSDIIWEPHHLDMLLKHAAKAFHDLVMVAVNTGLRLGDLRRVPWTAVGEDAIVFQTGKSRGRRTIVVPITDELRDILAAIPRVDSVMILNSARGRPWSEAGVESAIQRAKRDALEEARERHGADAKTDIEHRRVHDFRGTAATNFIRAGLFDDDIAEVLGWKKERVAEIRKRYVSGQEIGLAIVRRMRENKARAEAVNRPVNPAQTGPGGR